MNITHTRSLDPRLLGKSAQYLNGAWGTHTTDIYDLVAWAYVGGRAFCAGIFDLDTPLNAGEKSARRNDRWTGSQLAVIDLDSADGWTLEQVLDLPIVKSAAAVFPSSSYAPDTLKLHILYTLSLPVDNMERYRQIGAHLAEQFPFKVDNATLNPAQAVYGTVYTRPEMFGHTRALDDGLCWINPAPVPVNVPAVLSARLLSGQYTPDRDDAPRGSDHQAQDDGELPRRVAAHLAASPSRQLSVTLDALKWALRTWGNEDREGRMPLIMSAHAACSDPAVRDMFLSHSAPAWDASTQKANLATWWASHVPREGGYTVLTLFRAARLNGWLQYSDVELSGYEEIYTEEVGDWLVEADIPTRLLLKSPTGTGKTQGAIRYLKHLGTPRALFIAPSVKLSMALSVALTQAGVENTLYIESNNKTRDAETLRKAHVLVTTLQTLAVKVVTTAFDMASIGLVVIDEPDELFSAFVRSGVSAGLGSSSHVNKDQARYGIDTLTRIFREAGRVLLLDGTATDLSRYMMQTLSPHPTGVYVNTFMRDKATVTIYNQINALRNDIVTEVALGRRVVVACDTRAEAALMEIILKITDVVDAKDMIRITGDTVADKRVGEFFGDVEQGAARYQVVIYNSAMGSGVSIVNTQPDTVYLIASFLSPSKLIQIINRYRQQTKVKAFVLAREALYSETTLERYARMLQVIKAETELAGLPVLPRNETARIVAKAALIAATHEFDQRRSVRDFFTRLLREDGRGVQFIHTDTESLKEETQYARELIKERKAEIMSGWRSVPPLERGAALPKDISVDDAAKGMLHGIIRSEFGDKVNHTDGIEDDKIAELALHFRPYRWTIDRWLNPDRIMTTTVDELHNTRREKVTFRLYFSRVELITLVGTLLPDIHKTYTDDDIAERAGAFVKEISKRLPVYDMIASSHLSFEAAAERAEDDIDLSKMLSGAILKSVGLRLKRKNGKRRSDGSRERVTYVDGRDDLQDYLYLKGYGRDVMRRLDYFNRPTFERAATTARAASASYSAMDANQQRDILTSLGVLDDVTFEAAVSLQRGKMYS